MWAVLNAIFYVLADGIQWRALPSDCPAWQPFTPTFATGTMMAHGFIFMANYESGAELNRASSEFLSRDQRQPKCGQSV